MTRVALTDPNRTRAMVEEDAANVETLLRDMANRLTLMANVLHDMADANVRPTEGDVRQMDRFFAQGQPFRDYKAAVKQPDYTERCEKSSLRFPRTIGGAHCWNPPAEASTSCGSKESMTSLSKCVPPCDRSSTTTFHRKS